MALPDDYKLPPHLYRYKLPEDYVMQPEHRKQLDALVAKTGISNVDAQAFVDLHIDLTEDFVDRLQPALKAIMVRRIMFWVITLVVVNIAANLVIHY